VAFEIGGHSPNRPVLSIRFGIYLDGGIRPGAIDKAFTPSYLSGIPI